VETSAERAQRTFIKFALGIPLGIVLLAFICWGGIRLYRDFESRHLARRAAAYLSGGDFRQATISARRSNQIKPTAEAARVLAQIAEHANDRSALEWRHQAVKLAPHSAEDLVALATCALQFNEIPDAEKARAAAVKIGETAAAHAIAAEIADTNKNDAEARKEWKQAVDLDPNNKSYALGFALANLRSDVSESRDAGRAVLEKLQADKDHRLAATRGLIADAISHHDSADRLKKLEADLQSYPESTFSDRLLYVDILQAVRDPDFFRALTQVEKDATANPNDLSRLIAWLNSRGVALLALDFAHSLDPKTLTEWPVPLELANSYMRVADWEGLERLAKTGPWPQLDFMRHAFLARALREQKKTEAANREWSTATNQAANDPSNLERLQRATVDWNWKDEAVQLLWQMAKFPEKRTDALRALYQHYAKQSDTRDLYRVLIKLAEATPADLTVQNNLAQISLLLNVDAEHARKLAEELHHRDPTNPAYTSTYAFALYSEGNPKQAIRMMKSLSNEQLQDPAASAYLGIFLAADGEIKEARPYLNLGKKAALLPEEKALLDRFLADAGMP
jgi:tetratricopeptide (TPR) repeat protein